MHVIRAAMEDKRTIGIRKERSMPTSSLHELATHEPETAAGKWTKLRPSVGVFRVFFLCLTICSGAAFGAAQDKQDKPVQTTFRVKFIADGVIYLEGGHDLGLAEGQRLTVKRETQVNGTASEKEIADIRILSVASTSAVAEIVSATSDLQVGDMASLSSEDVEKLKIQQVSRDARKYPQVITFTEGDPMDEEARESLPQPKSPEVNRLRGRIGLEYNSITEPGGSGMSSSQLGLVLRVDMTRIGGSFWTLSGYYRGRFISRTPTSQETINDLINRTYHLNLTYNNPGSHWVAGFGRFYLPWASSLDTIDGGYLGRRNGKFTYGLFGGTAPDPTSWDYAPNRQIGGGFFNIEGGNFDSFRYTSTVGLAFTRVNWHPDRQYLFWESGWFYKRYISIYHDIEGDLVTASSLTSPTGVTPVASDTTSSGAATTDSSGPKLSRDFLTVRYQPHHIISFDLTENYFRNVPTFDARLISTGLLDKVLFQGLSGGVRLELPYRISPYVNIGKSNSAGDARDSWNKMYGVTWSNIWRTGLRADFRYSQFDSSFGSGSYRTLMIGRQLGESLRFDIQAGDQNLVSAFTNESHVRWITGNMDWFLSRHYFLGSGVTIYRGHLQDYNQWFVNFGYRF
jgi:hypothetical protein